MNDSTLARQRGSALITAMVVILILGSLIVSFASVSSLNSVAAKADLNGTQAFYRAEGANEQMRLELVTDYRTSGLTVQNWLDQIRAGARFGGEQHYDAGYDASWVRRSSDADAGYGWIEVESLGQHRTGENPEAGAVDPSERRIVQRVSFGNADIFRLAFLTETTNCMFCHATIRGDVGTLDFFRPGFGNEGGSGIGSGSDSKINGSLFAASTITGDDVNLFSDPKKVNGTIVTGDIHTNYSGSELPRDTDGDGRPNFPIIDPDVVERNALGTLEGGETLIGVPAGEAYSNEMARTDLDSLDGSYTGNLILRGTEENPVIISGNVYASGDVLIEGVVKGRGAIYSGRNIYVTGDLVYSDPPRLPNSDEDPDEVALENIAADKDELRLAARDNVVLGDWIDDDPDGNLLPTRERQAADFFRKQFDLRGDSPFHRETGEELDFRDGHYFTSGGDEIPVEKVVMADTYDGVIKPVFFDDNGNMVPWLTGDEYREILGTQTLTDDTWRGNFVGNQDKIVSLLLDNGFTMDEIQSMSSRGLGWNDSTSTYLSGDIWGPNYNLTVRKVVDGEAVALEQVERVDAFLYSNKRIAGKTSGTNLAINGGMIASEIGVLAPGIRKESWMRAHRYDYLNTKANEKNPLNDERYGKMVITYDYRLRNGGFGFDLVAGEIGRRLLWQPR